MRQRSTGRLIKKGIVSEGQAFDPTRDREELSTRGMEEERLGL